MNRSDIEHLFVTSVSDALIGQSQNTQNDENNSRYCSWFHGVCLRGGIILALASNNWKQETRQTGPKQDVLEE